MTWWNAKYSDGAIESQIRCFRGISLFSLHICHFHCQVERCSVKSDCMEMVDRDLGDCIILYNLPAFYFLINHFKSLSNRVTRIRVAHFETNYNRYANLSLVWYKPRRHFSRLDLRSVQARNMS